MIDYEEVIDCAVTYMGGPYEFRDYSGLGDILIAVDRVFDLNHASAVFKTSHAGTGMVLRTAVGHASLAFQDRDGKPRLDRTLHLTLDSDAKAVRVAPEIKLAQHLNYLLTDKAKPSVLALTNIKDFDVFDQMLPPLVFVERTITAEVYGYPVRVLIEQLTTRVKIGKTGMRAGCTTEINGMNYVVDLET